MIIDGRMGDVVATGFVEGDLIVPGFVLEELQSIADSAEPGRGLAGAAASTPCTACRRPTTT